MGNIKYLNNLSIVTYRHSPRLVSITLALNIIEGLTTGIGFLILIPLFHLTGLYDKNIPSPKVINMEDYLGFSPGLLLILSCYTIIVAAVSVLQYFTSVNLIKVEHGLICDVRDRLYRGILTCDWKYLINQERANFINSLTTQVQMLGQSAKNVLMLWGQLALLLIYLMFSIFISWQVTALAIFVFMLVFIATMPNNKKIKLAGIDETISFRTIYKEITEHFSNIKLVKTHGIEDVVAERTNAHGVLLKEYNLRLAKYMGLTKLMGITISVVSISGIIYVSLTFANVAFATLLIMLVIFSRLWPVLSNVYKSYQMLIYRKENYFQLKDSIENISAHQENIGFESKIPVLNERIVTKNIAFSYKSKGGVTHIFKDLSIVVPCRSIVAIVGTSGAGKTTLADLIAGLLEPDSGEIFCDGVLLDGEARAAWRKQVAYITQDPLFFNSSIKENLLYLNNKSISVDEKDIRDALNYSGANFVFDLAEGINTDIGDNGIRLSGGQKQRLAIARALLRKPQLLILDEATSALDRENEKTVQESLFKLKGKVTMLIIAHRSEIVSIADHVIDVNQYSVV